MSSGNIVESGVPPGWSVTELSQVIPKAQYGISSSLNDENGIPVLRMNNLHGGFIDISELKFSTSPEAESLLLQPNDVLFNRTNSMDHVGRTSLWRGELPKASFASYLVRLIPDPNRLDGEYLVRWLNLPQVQIAIRCFATPGVHQVNINPTNLRKIEICLPEDVGEQRTINKIIKTLDNLIEKTERLMAKYQAIKHGMMHDFFTCGVDAHGHLRRPQTEVPDLYKQSELGWIPKEWEVCFLDEVAIRGSGHTPNKLIGAYWNGGVKWVSLADSDKLDSLFITDTDKNISELGLANSSAVRHRPGTVILSRDAGIGKSAIISEVMAVSQHFMAWFCGPRLVNYFLYYWLQHEKPRFEAIAMGSTIKTIGLSFFKKLRIAVPQMQEQLVGSDDLLAVERLLFGLADELAKYKAQKTGLMQDLLTGKVRVKVDESEEVTTHA